MNQPDEMDLTLYLQTEGRRLAAELAKQKSASGQYRPSSPTQTQQQQCNARPDTRPARSLSETLQRMGITNAHPRRRV